MKILEFLRSLFTRTDVEVPMEGDHTGNAIGSKGDMTARKPEASHEQNKKRRLSPCQGAAFGQQDDVNRERQDQMQEQIIRNAQASLQMVYGVYGNTITMLEELETRELKKKKHRLLPRSEIEVHDQSGFSDEEIQGKLDTQLLILQTQLGCCHDEIKKNVKEEMKMLTLNWSSLREEEMLPYGKTDEYAQKLFGLLVTGKTDHPKKSNCSPLMGKEDMQETLGAIVHGQHKQTDLDRVFKNDPKRKAIVPKMRQTAGVDKGADRMMKERPDFEDVVDNYRTNVR